MSGSYELTKQNKLRQLREKARYDKETVHSILDAGLVVEPGVHRRVLVRPADQVPDALVLLLRRQAGVDHGRLEAALDQRIS